MPLWLCGKHERYASDAEADGYTQGSNSLSQSLAARLYTSSQHDHAKNMLNANGIYVYYADTFQEMNLL